MIRKYVITIVCAALTLTSCNFGLLDWPYIPADGTGMEGELTPAGPLSPDSGVTYELDDYAEPICLTWSKPSWTGIGFATCNVVFDLPEGDFSTPIASYGISSPDTLSKAFTKDEAKALFNTAVVGKAASVDLKWAVRTSAGGKKLVSEAKSLTLTMTPEPDPFVAGNVLYIAGEGAKEAGRHMVYLPTFTNGFSSRDFNDNNCPTAASANLTSNCPGRMYCVGGSATYDYEIYTELEAGKPLYFWSGGSKGSEEWFFVPQVDYSLEPNWNPAKDLGQKLVKYTKKDVDTTFTVSASGLYRIRYSSGSGEFIAQKFDRASFRYWPNAGGTANTTVNMTYAGDGKWTLDITPTNWGRGFKFILFGLPQDQPHGALNIGNSDIALGTSLADTPEAYWYVCCVKGGAADPATNAPTNGTWPFASFMAGNGYHLVLHLNDDKPGYFLEVSLL